MGLSRRFPARNGLSRIPNVRWRRAGRRRLGDGFVHNRGTDDRTGLRGIFPRPSHCHIAVCERRAVHVRAFCGDLGCRSVRAREAPARQTARFPDTGNRKSSDSRRTHRAIGIARTKRSLLSRSRGARPGRRCHAVCGRGGRVLQSLGRNSASAIAPKILSALSSWIICMATIVRPSKRRSQVAGPRLIATI